jgi:hypothetical protein
MPQNTAVDLTYWHATSCVSWLDELLVFFSASIVCLASGTLTYQAAGIKIQLQYFRYAVHFYVLVKVFFRYKNGSMSFFVRYNA